MSWLATDLNLGWNLSICISASVLRLTMIPVSVLLDKISWKSPKFLEDSFAKAERTFILNDLERDVKRAGLTESHYNALKEEVRFSVLMRQAALGYLSLSYIRGLHHLCYTPEYYEGLTATKFLFWSITQYDPFFVLPLVTASCTYFTLKRSFHPFTIWMNRTVKLTIGFTSSVLSFYAPVGYLQAYTSFALTHALVKKFRPSINIINPK